MYPRRLAYNTTELSVNEIRKAIFQSAYQTATSVFGYYKATQKQQINFVFRKINNRNCIHIYPFSK